MLGAEFKRNGIDHVVLNAKPEHAQREGETISQAGRLGAVTIATNMAGRGVDIKLGGDPDAMAQAAARKQGLNPGDEGWDDAVAIELPALKEQCEAEGDKVRELGGLYICGTERHESRRIDNQLRGRSGRQGDPGESRFFLSAEDDLVRLFAGDRIYKILDRLGPVDEHGEEYPLEAKMLTKQIEGAQKKVEQQNFLIRKRVLEYDDVMNEQRRVVYKYRREILEGRDMSEVARAEVGAVPERLVQEFTTADVFEEWDLAGLARRRSRSGRSRSTSSRSIRRPRPARRSGGCSPTTSSPRTRRAPRSSGPSSWAGSSARCSSRSSTTAGASTSTRWTTSARASTSAASPRSIRSSPTRTRAS